MRGWGRGCPGHARTVTALESFGGIVESKGKAVRLFPAFSKVFFAVGLLVAMWGLSVVDRSDRRAWVHPSGGPVRILQFYASTGIVAAGGKGRLCFSVGDAQTASIS